MLFLCRPFDIIPEGVWFEESNDLIRSCAALSATLGIQKSFSTSDITQLPGPPDLQQSASGAGGGGGCGISHSQHHHPHPLGHATSELALNSLQRCGYMLDNPRLDHASRSCSTWVAVGELASASQLPSPHGGPANPTTQTTAGLLAAGAAGTPPPPLPAPAFTAADLIRSVNKKVRQNYIRRRLLTTYRALERLSQSEFNLDRLEAEAAAATEMMGPGPTELLVPSAQQQPTQTVVAAVVGGPQPAQPMTASTPSTTVGEEHFASLASGGGGGGPAAAVTTNNNTTATTTITTTTTTTTLDALQVKAARMSLEAASMKQKLLNISEKNSLLTIDDIEKERGKPLSKYDRNMMIFNWLHSLDEVVDELAEEPPSTTAQMSTQPQ